MTGDARRIPPRPRFDGCAGRLRRSPSAASARAPPGRPAASASTTVQPLLLADRSSSSRSASVTRSASWSGSTTRRSIGADVAAGPDRRPEREDRATDDDPLRSRRRRRWPAAGRRAGASGPLRRAGFGTVASAARRRSSATMRSMSVTRAARTRYSTPTGPTSQGSATMALDRGSTEATPGPAIHSSAASDGSLTTR